MTETEAPGSLYTLTDPPKPVVETLDVRAGSTIVLTGKVLSPEQCGESRFTLDLCCGLLVSGDHRDNVFLHFNPRFDLPGGWFSGEPDRQIVVNTLINNEWGREERYNNAFKVGENFKLEIRVFKEYCKIAVDDRHLCDFEHRVRVETVRCIMVQGCIEVHSLTIPK
ncbi:hypothetical protein PMAYCL1PPCAC_29145 [Pristionchus mayeri]|uniref:Galectin n=1 Tax=Pristionchus mayeri TaxID=1317129 RepID=A0AAN5ICC7_9BILA|nr:hypothetical protein PMAYCL1PPCAC_29145 [Pristionchus mayeri]